MVEIWKRWENEDRLALEQAHDCLERHGFAIALAEATGYPVERAIGLLPKAWRKLVDESTRRALNGALRVALTTLGRKGYRGDSRDKLHRYAALVFGGAGGALGITSLPVELALTTVLILRSIAEIASSEGEKIDQPEGQLACLQVFALYDRSGKGKIGGYYSVRGAMATSVTEALIGLRSGGLQASGEAAVGKFMEFLIKPFGKSVATKIAGITLPVVGALSGAIITGAFMQHYQRLARGHFILRRLERKYGIERVKESYERLAR